MVLLAAVAAVMVAAHAGALGPLQCAEEERLLDERKRNGAKRLSKIPPQPLKKKRVRAADVGAAARVAKMRQRRLDEGVTMRGGPRQKQSKKSRMVDSNRKPNADGLFVFLCPGLLPGKLSIGSRPPGPRGPPTPWGMGPSTEGSEKPSN